MLHPSCIKEYAFPCPNLKGLIRILVQLKIFPPFPICQFNLLHCLYLHLRTPTVQFFFKSENLGMEKCSEGDLV